MIALYALSDKDFSIFTTVTTATTVLFSGLRARAHARSIKRANIHRFLCLTVH